MADSLDAETPVDDFLEDREFSPLKDVCLSLDEVILSLFETLDGIHQCQADLDVAMKNGYLLMAKARYSMGSKKVSCLQYDLHSNDEALVHVGVYNDAGPPTFRITTDSPVSPVPEITPQDVVRRRQTPSSTCDSSSRVQDVELKEFGGGDCVTRKRDPIKWFGVLVPQPLRESQRRFSGCAELCCELATLKAKLMQQQQEFQRLMKRKVDMIAN